MADHRPKIEDAEAAYEAGDLDQTLEICEELLQRDATHVDALYLLGEAMLELEEFEAANEIFHDVLRFDPESAGGYNGIGIAQFELCKFDEARAALETSVELNPRLPESQMYLGYFHERRGEVEQAQDCFRQAIELNGDQFHIPIEVTTEVMMDAMERVLHKLSNPLKTYLLSIPWEIEALPTTAMLLQSYPPMSPLTLCVFRGEPRDPMRVTRPLDHRPDEIRLFAANFGKTVEDTSELPPMLLKAVIHELVHFLDLDAAEGESLGLDALFEQLEENSVSGWFDEEQHTLH